MSLAVADSRALKAAMVTRCWPGSGLVVMGICINGLICELIGKQWLGHLLCSSVLSYELFPGIQACSVDTVRVWGGDLWGKFI